MFTIKLKYKDSNEVMYAGEYLIREKSDIRKNATFDLKTYFILSLDRAKSLYKDLIYRNKNYGDKELEYISIVELSNYEPHSEYQVLEYREFK